MINIQFKINLLLVFTRSNHSGTFILPDLVMFNVVVQELIEWPTLIGSTYILRKAMVDSCWLTSLTETDCRECHSDYGGESKSIGC